MSDLKERIKTKGGLARVLGEGVREIQRAVGREWLGGGHGDGGGKADK